MRDIIRKLSWVEGLLIPETLLNELLQSFSGTLVATLEKHQ